MTDHIIVMDGWKKIITGIPVIDDLPVMNGIPVIDDLPAIG